MTAYLVARAVSVKPTGVFTFGYIDDGRVCDLEFEVVDVEKAVVIAVTYVVRLTQHFRFVSKFAKARGGDVAAAAVAAVAGRIAVALTRVIAGYEQPERQNAGDEQTYYKY